jgi:hypothetical protein
MLSNRRGVSYAISAVIMTATIIVLVLVTGTYSYQVLEQQRGAAEFEVAKKSILAFDDALENIAWKPQGARSARFTVNYGQLELIPDMPLTLNAVGYDGANYSSTTGTIRYSITTTYVNFGANYSSYLLGSERMLSNGTGSYGSLAVTQDARWVTMTLTYGVRAMKTSTVNVTEGEQQVVVNYVDIWITNVQIDKWSTYVGDFDLQVKCLGVETLPSEVYDVNDGNRQFNLTAQFGDGPLSSILVQLDANAEKVVFNFVVATLQVSV